jgi:hypothetical protein
MHPEVLEDKKGVCSICRMDLVPVRLDTVWSCPVHSAIVITRGGPGTCPICRRDLVQVTVAVSWTCRDHPEIDQIDPGTCPGGGAMIRKLMLRPHGNHNAQHGGIFFMAPDNWHHLEGTYDRDGRFRLHLYDDYSRSLPRAKMKLVAARVGTTPLRLAANGEYLETIVRPVSLPAEMTARVVFKRRKSPAYRFDFLFDRFSSDPAPKGPTAALAGNITPQLSALSSQPSALGLQPSALSPQEALALLGAKTRAIKDLIDRGAFAEIYVPALEAKDLALAIDARAPEINERSAGPTAAIGAAVKRVVRAAWRLDATGDLGDRTQIADAYAEFTDAVAALESAMHAKPR